MTDLINRIDEFLGFGKKKKETVKKDKKSFIFYVKPNTIGKVKSFLKKNGYSYMAANERTTISGEYRIVVYKKEVRDELIKKFNIDEFEE